MRPDPNLAKTLALRKLREERDQSEPRRRTRERKQAKLWELHDELTFGKHVGRTIDYVIEHHRGWVVWMIENADDFELSPAAQEEFEASADPRRPPRAWEE